MITLNYNEQTTDGLSILDCEIKLRALLQSSTADLVELHAQIDSCNLGKHDVTVVMKIYVQTRHDEIINAAVQAVIKQLYGYDQDGCLVSIRLGSCVH